MSETGTIAVLGAGISGLVAAYELERLRHDVVVLEAAPRVGGRILTHRFGDPGDPGDPHDPGGPVAELGAMRIPASHDLTLRYVDSLGLGPSLRHFSNILSDPGNYLRISGKLVRVRDAAGALIRDTSAYGMQVPRKTDTLLFLGWLRALVEALAPRELRELVRTDVETMLRFADGLDLAPFIHRQGIDIGGALTKHPELRAAISGRLAGFLDDMTLELGTETLYLSGGMDQLTQGLAARLRRPVLTRHAVAGIDVRPDGVLVTFDHGHTRSSQLFGIVLCTIPFSVVRDLALTGLDADKLDTIATLDYGSSTKVALRCSSAFWTRAGITGGASALGGYIRQTYYPPQDGDPALGAALLGSYTIAEDADVLGGLPEDERHRVVMRELTAVHPELATPGVVLDVTSMAWGESVLSRGCAARRWGLTGEKLDHEVERAVRPQGRLFFAGEHCSHAPAWINSGIASALNAVAQIGGLA